MVIRIKRPLLWMTTTLMMTLYPVQIGLSQDKNQAQIVAEVAFQRAAVDRSDRSVVLLNQALSLVESMTNECYKAAPLVRVANGYQLVGQSQKGQQLLARAFRIARTQTISNCTLSATSPEESLLNRAGDYAEAGYYDFAQQILQGVDNWFRPIAMVRVAHAYQTARKPKQAKQLLGEAIALTLKNPDLRNRQQMLLAIAFELRRTGQVEYLPNVLKQLLIRPKSSSRSEEDRAWAIVHTLQASDLLIASGEKAQATALLDQVLPEIKALRSTQFPLAKVSAFVQATTQLADLGQLERAQSILAIAQSTVEASRSMRDDALAQVASGYVQIGQVQMARNLARRINTQQHRERVLSAISRRDAKAGNVEQAVQLARSLKTARQGTLFEIIRYYLANGELESALQVARSEQIQDLLPEVALAYAEAGKPQQAKQILQSLKSKGANLDWVMPDVAKSFTKQRQLEQALGLVQTVKQKDYRSRTLIAIAVQYHAIDPVKNREKAIELLDQALKISQLSDER